MVVQSFNKNNIERVKIRLLEDLEKKVENMKNLINKELKIVKEENKDMKNINRNPKKYNTEEKNLEVKEIIDTKNIIEIYKSMRKEIEELINIENMEHRNIH